jgi:hypothetical protein
MIINHSYNRPKAVSALLFFPAGVPRTAHEERSPRPDTTGAPGDGALS